VHQKNIGNLPSIRKYGEGYSEKIHLVFDSASGEPRDKKNHYRFLIDPKFVPALNEVQFEITSFLFNSIESILKINLDCSP
jgi:hypothetical protein